MNKGNIQIQPYETPKASPVIKIFVSHRIDMDCEGFQNPLFVPVRCGATYDKRVHVSMLGDNTGDHISHKHPLLSELTVQYWAWKNQEADYYGLCHYRRFWNFSAQRYAPSAYGTVQEEYISEASQQKYSLDETSMRQCIEAHDLILPEPINVGKLPGRYKNLKDQFCRASSTLTQKDFEVMESLLQEKDPEMFACAKAYFSGQHVYFCNMGIMKAEIFHAYCSWLYPLLFELEKRLDFTHYSEESLRTLGHLAERLFGVFVTYLKRTRKDLKIKHLQTVVFERPEKVYKPVVPAGSVVVALAASNSFVAPLSVCLKSILMHANPLRRFDFLILTSNMDRQNQKILNDMRLPYSNAHLHFVNARPFLEGYHLKTYHHITVETFFRFLIQDILPDCNKVLYLDSDTVVKRDLSELFDTDINDYFLAAVKDPDFIGQFCGAIPGTMEYTKEVLQLQDPYSYFQAGVLLLNLDKMRQAYSLQQWLTFAAENYRYSDQDVLNKYCQGQVKYLDPRWNVLYDCDNYRVPKVISQAPKEIKDAYMQSRQDPYVIHFAGGTKPWHKLPVDFGEQFWQYAQKTPYYEQLIYEMTVHLRQSPFQKFTQRINHAIKKFVDWLFPPHSPARERLKKLLLKLKII